MDGFGNVQMARRAREAEGRTCSKGWQASRPYTAMVVNHLMLPPTRRAAPPFKRTDIPQGQVRNVDARLLNHGFETTTYVVTVHIRTKHRTGEAPERRQMGRNQNSAWTAEMGRRSAAAPTGSTARTHETSHSQPLVLSFLSLILAASAGVSSPLAFSRLVSPARAHAIMCALSRARASIGDHADWARTRIHMHMSSQSRA
eukprot:5539138-Pleurochrysis_carterae.AAC.1